MPTRDFSKAKNPDETLEEFLARRREFLKALRREIDFLCEEYLGLFDYPKADFRKVAEEAVRHFIDYDEGVLPPPPAEDDPAYVEKDLTRDIHEVCNSYLYLLDINEDDFIAVTNEAVDYFLYTDERDRDYDPSDPWKTREGRGIPHTPGYDPPVTDSALEPERIHSGAASTPLPIPIQIPRRSAMALQHSQLSDFVSFQSQFTCRDTNDFLDQFESFVEKECILVLRNLGIKAVVERDRLSLPYKSEVTVTIPFQSTTNAVFEYDRIFRKAVKKLLDEERMRICFYIWTDVVEMNPEEWFPHPPDHPWHYGIRYHFRYCTPGDLA